LFYFTNLSFLILIHLLLATIDFISEGRKIIENQIPDIPYDELEFVSKTEIGEGSFSKVFQCRWKNIDVAFKKLKCRPGFNFDNNFKQLFSQ